MDWITDDIAIGDRDEAQDVDLLVGDAFHSVLGLIPTLRGRKPAELGLEAIELAVLADGRGNTPGAFRRAVDALERLVRTHPPVLVHCRAGRNRSVAVVAGYLMRERGFSPAEALSFLNARRVHRVVPELRHLLDTFGG